MAAVLGGSKAIPLLEDYAHSLYYHPAFTCLLSLTGTEASKRFFVSAVNEKCTRYDLNRPARYQL